MTQDWSICVTRVCNYIEVAFFKFGLRVLNNLFVSWKFGNKTRKLYPCIIKFIMNYNLNL